LEEKTYLAISLKPDGRVDLRLQKYPSLPSDFLKEGRCLDETGNK
jgi:hypothetical protein